MTDQWIKSDGTPIESDWDLGLPLSDDWILECGCSGPTGKTSIVDTITMTGSPATITSVAGGQSLWSIVLNDGTPQADFAIDRFDDTGALVDSPMTIVRATGVVSFHDPVMLVRDPVEDMEAVTKEYVDAHASGIPEAPMDNYPYARYMATWERLPQTYIPEAPSGQIFGRFNATWAPVPIQADAPNDGGTYGRMNGAWNAALAITGGTIMGSLTVNQILTVNGPNSMVLNAAGGNQRAILGQTSGLTRWQLQLGDQVAEGLNNAGSNFSLTAYTNLGGFLGTWLSISRADGTATFAGHVNVNGGLAVNGLLAVNDVSNLYIPGGSNGQVMTTNGAGALSWTDKGGGGGGGASITVGDTPPSSPAVGALWWDSVGGQLYVWYADANSSQWVIAVNAAAAGSGASISVGATPPASPSVGALWFDANSAQLYCWYNDGNSSQWVPTTNQMGGGYLLAQGVTNGASVPSGQIGELITATASAPVGNATTNVAQVTTISVPAGNWDIWGDCQFNPAGNTLSAYYAVITTTNASLAGGKTACLSGATALGQCAAAIPMVSVILTAPTIYRLNAAVTVSASGCTANANIYARRRA